MIIMWKQANRIIASNIIINNDDNNILYLYCAFKETHNRSQKCTLKICKYFHSICNF